MSNLSTVYSKQKIQCDFPNCGKLVRRDHMKEHENSHKEQRKGGIMSYFKKKVSEPEKPDKSLEEPGTSRAGEVNPAFLKKFPSAPAASGFVDKVKITLSVSFPFKFTYRIFFYQNEYFTVFFSSTS